MITHSIMETTQWDAVRRHNVETHRAVVRDDGKTLYIGEMRVHKSDALADAAQFMAGLSEVV